MLSPNLPEPELLKTILQPLLDDFQYWFERSRNLLETEEIAFLTEQKQSALLEQVKHAQQEVATAKTLFEATDGQAGIAVTVLMVWHQLLTECWQVATRLRLERCKSVQNPNQS